MTDTAGLADFVNVTGAFGSKWFPETVGGGVAFLDVDGDHWQDVALVGGGTWPERSDQPVRSVWLFRNNGDGTFTDITDRSGLSDVRAYGQGIASADYDADGDDDIYLTTLSRNLLLRNDAGTFVDRTNEAGLADEEVWSTSALFFDAEADGDLDLYVGNYVDWSPEKDIRCTIDGENKAYCTPQLYTGIPGSFYVNNGDGTFDNRTAQAGFSQSPGKTLGVAEWDFNDDGFSDLVVANDTQRDLLFINNGDGTFTESGVASGIAFDENGRSRAGMGIDIGVIDGSGRPAIVVGHFTNEMIGVYQQIGENLFMDRAAQSRIGRPSIPTLTFGLVMTDADADGDLDVFVANGHIDEDAERVQEGVSYRQYPQLFVNDGNGRFEDFGPPVPRRIVARGLASADYDRDGDEDLIITENGGPVYLLRNDQVDANALRLVLVGEGGNRGALGAKVEVFAGRRIVRRVRTGSSYLSCSERALTIGLGDNVAADSILIRWPSRNSESVTDLAGGFEYHIAEGEGVVTRSRLQSGESGGQGV
ncbi:MAG: CRTAC1 family protein [Rhodothermales bacterium]|nr:CRTAC1 family protein [Rhodothermales bacterium]